MLANPTVKVWRSVVKKNLLNIFFKQVAELLDSKTRNDDSRPIARAMGVFDVTAMEAEVVISFVRSAQDGV